MTDARRRTPRPIPRRAKEAIALGALLLLTACDSLVLDTEALLRRPTLNERQAQVYAAVESTVSGEITYRYMQGGDYRTPFIFYDMDGEGLDEAIVFYSDRTDPSSTRTKILVQQEDGGWATVHDFSTECDQVDFVRFAPMLSTQSHCMVVGWQETGELSSRPAGKYLGVYSLENGIFTTEIRLQSYVDYTIHDFNGDGLAEIAAIERDKNRALHIALLLAEGRHIVAGFSQPLCPDADAVLRATTGELWDGANAIFIDEAIVDGLSVATEVIRVSDSGLETLVGGSMDDTASPTPAWENFQYTFRDRDGVVLSQDIDGDGVVEVPNPVALPGVQEDADEEFLRLIQFMNLTGEGFIIKSSAVVNQEEGYLVDYPDKWRDKVTVVVTGEPGEWKFFRVDPDTLDPAVEILRIEAYTGRQAESAAGRIHLDSRGSRHYSGYIPQTTGEETAITETELRQMFRLMEE